MIPIQYKYNTAKKHDIIQKKYEHNTKYNTTITEYKYNTNIIQYKYNTNVIQIQYKYNTNTHTIRKNIIQNTIQI